MPIIDDYPDGLLFIRILDDAATRYPHTRTEFGFDDWFKLVLASVQHDFHTLDTLTRGKPFAKNIFKVIEKEGKHWTHLVELVTTSLNVSDTQDEPYAFQKFAGKNIETFANKFLQSIRFERSINALFCDEGNDLDIQAPRAPRQATNKVAARKALEDAFHVIKERNLIVEDLPMIENRLLEFIDEITSEREHCCCEQ